MTPFDSSECLPSGSSEVIVSGNRSTRDGAKDDSKGIKKTPNVLFPSSSSCARNRNHNQKDAKEFLNRKRIVNLKQSTCAPDDYDPLDLLSMLGFERPSDGSDISFAELLSTSPTPGGKGGTLGPGPRRMEMSSLLSVHLEENEDACNGRGNCQAPSSTILSTSAPGQNCPVSSGITNNSSKYPVILSPNAIASQPMHIPPRLSYSPPSASSEDSMKDSMLSGSFGEKCANTIAFATGRMYYPTLLDDPQLMAGKQQHSSSHPIYPSYIVSNTVIHSILSLLIPGVIDHFFHTPSAGINHGLREKRSRPEERIE